MMAFWTRLLWVSIEITIKATMLDQRPLTICNIILGGLFEIQNLKVGSLLGLALGPRSKGLGALEGVAFGQKWTNQQKV